MCWLSECLKSRYFTVMTFVLGFVILGISHYQTVAPPYPTLPSGTVVQGLGLLPHSGKVSSSNIFVCVLWLPPTVQRQVC